MSEKVLLPREAGRFIAETSKDVEIKEEGVQKIAKLVHGIISLNIGNIASDKLGKLWTC